MNLDDWSHTEDDKYVLERSFSAKHNNKIIDVTIRMIVQPAVSRQSKDNEVVERSQSEYNYDRWKWILRYTESGRSYEFYGIEDSRDSAIHKVQELANNYLGRYDGYS